MSAASIAIASPDKFGVLLINPTITARRHARFPLAVMSLAAALDDRYATHIVDGNIDREFVATTLKLLESGNFHAVGVTVMGGPQLPPAIEVSRAIRARFPGVPIAWGGYFPTNCPDLTIHADYVDFVIRGQGEDTFREVLDAWSVGRRNDFEGIGGLTWKRDSEIVHNDARKFSTRGLNARLPYEHLDHPEHYLGRTFLGRRTIGYQAAIGCRFRCTFCGVATMFHGKTALPTAARLEADLRFFKDRLGVDSINFYDNNFFDREVDTEPLLDILAKHEMPWWSFARADALLNLSSHGWELVRKSRLRMTYIGAESPSDWLLHDIRKGTRADQTLAAVERCFANDVTPELSFMLAPPHDPEGETEATFEYIRKVKKLFPTTEIMLYVYTPLPRSRHLPNLGGQHSDTKLLGNDGRRVEFPTTVEQWAEPRWVRYWCHSDAPWLSERLRRRIADFTTVLGCRYPTAIDIRSSPWAKNTLRALASWRYRYRQYGLPVELNLSKRVIKLCDPRVTGL